MHIGFEASSFSKKNPTGITRYIHDLLSEIVFLSEDNQFSMLYKLSRLKKKKEWWLPPGSSLLTYHGKLWPIRKRIDLIHGLDGFAPIWRNTKSIITIHDIYVLLEEGENISSESFKKKKMKKFENLSAYEAIIAISHATKKDLINNFDINERKIKVIPLGINASFFKRNEEEIRKMRSRYHLDKDYLLFVGAISKRKNTVRLVQAFAESPAAGEMTLVIAGSMGYQGEEVLQVIRRHGLEGRVKILGYFAEEDLPALYSGAEGFLFPTLYEGFGIPILEAMACGTPVLVGNRGASPETAGGFAVEVDPLDVASIAAGIEKVLTTSSEHIEKGIRHASAFTWRRCAEETLDFYRQLF